MHTKLRDALLLATLLLTATACTTTRYINRTKGAPVYRVRFINDCAQGTAHLYFDREYRQKHRMNVRPKNIKKGEERILEFSAGRHTFVAEIFGFWSTEGLKVNGDFMVDRSGTIRICSEANR